MKKTALCLLAATAIMACKKETPANTQNNDSVAPATEQTTAAAPDTTKFDVTKLHLSTKELGTFPYLVPSKGYSYNYHEQAEEKDISPVDKQYFAVAGRLFPIEGKSYKINIERSRTNGQKFSAEEVLKHYKDAIAALGGEQVNDVAITKEEYKRIGEAELIDNKHGYTLDPNLIDRIKTFVIRQKDKAVWIQLCLLNEESGRIAVVEQVLE